MSAMFFTCTFGLYLVTLCVCVCLWVGGTVGVRVLAIVFIVHILVGDGAFQAQDISKPTLQV